MKNTGERFLAEHVNTETGLEHMHRYQFAIPYTEGKNVLDIASGEGYGSQILATKAKSVLGIDISTEAIEYAKNTYTNPNLHFKVGSCVHFDTEQTFETIVSFETLEHVSREDQELFLAEIKKHLAPGGITIISTPNKSEYSTKRHFKNPYHIHELETPDYIDFLKKYFKNVLLYKQKIVAASIIYAEEGTKPRYDHIPTFTETYALCICSDGPIKPRTGSIYFDQSTQVFETLSAKYLHIIEAIHRNILLRGMVYMYKKLSKLFM